MADTSGGVWAVDPESATAASLQDPSLHHVALPALPPSRSPLSARPSSSPDLVVLAGPQVLDIDTSRPALSSLVLPAAAQSTQVAVASNRAYLLDASAAQLETVDLAPLRPPWPRYRVPAGADQLVTKDQLVFVNSTGSAQALVVNASGSVTAITKYVPAPPTPARGRAATPAAAGGPEPGSAGPSPGSAGRSRGHRAAPHRRRPLLRRPGSSADRSTADHSTPVDPASDAAVCQPSSNYPPPSTQPPTVPGSAPVTPGQRRQRVVTVDWAPPASDGGSPILSYQVTATPSGARQSVGAATTSATLTGQPDGVRECVQVQAVNRRGRRPAQPRRPVLRHAPQGLAGPGQRRPGQRVGAGPDLPHLGASRRSGPTTRRSPATPCGVVRRRSR